MNWRVRWNRSPRTWKPTSREKSRVVLIVLRRLLVLLCVPALLFAESFEDVKLRSGIKIFRVILKGDASLATKKAGDGSLLVLLVGAEGAPARFADLAREMQAAGAIANLPVTVKPVAASSLAAQADPVAGLFVAESLGDDLLHKTVQFGTDRKAITFSPFDGDVEKGVLCGVSFEAKVVPFINSKTLKASGINMSPTVLKVAKIHD